jgi:oligopeptide/dipeptide ABC transporter ATP-binding protein
METLLEARNATKVYGGGFLRKGDEVVALDNFSLKIDIDPPSITAGVGESGSGKTTLARLLLGMTPPTSGEILYQGRDITKMSRAEKREFLRDVQVILQDPYEAYNPFYRVDHVLEMPLKKFKITRSRRESRQRIEETLEAVGLRPEDTLGRFPHQLSGGQRQRVMVARALLVRPRIIIADEPVSMVDASLRATILQSLQTLTRDFGVSLIYITHDLTTAYQISDNVLVFYRGSVAEAGNAELVVPEPEHPYTQLLVGSIPQPDPKRAWAEELGATEIGRRADIDISCKFADRCPHAMEMCLEARPPLYKTSENRAAACYLYRDSPTLSSDDIGEVFVRPQPQRAETAAD